MSEREGTGQRRMRIHRGAHAAWVACVSDGSMSEDVRRTIDAVSEWPTATRGHVGRHTKNMAHLMGCSLAYALAESGKGGRKSAPIDEWRESSGLGKPAEQLLRTLCAMGQMSRVKKRDPRTGSRRKVWHYGFFDAASYYDKVKRENWPTRGGVTVSRNELQRYGGAWDVTERHSVDMGDDAIATSAEHGRGCESRFIDPMTLAVGIACGRYVVNDDGTVSMASTGWGTTTEPVGELDGEPVYDTGSTDEVTGLPLPDVERPADPHGAQAAFRAMGEAIDGATRAMSGAAGEMASATTWTKDDNFPLCDTDPVEVHRFVVLVYDHEEAGREECRRRIDNRCYVDQVLQSVSGEGQTITAEWHDRHPLNLTSTDGDAWFQAEYAKQSGAMPPDVGAITMTPSPVVTMHDGAAVLCGSVEQGREVDALRARVAELEATVADKERRIDAYNRETGYLQSKLDAVAAKLGADPALNPDVVTWAARTVQERDTWRYSVNNLAMQLGATTSEGMTNDAAVEHCVDTIDRLTRTPTVNHADMLRRCAKWEDEAAAWSAQNIAGHALGLDVDGDDPKRVQAGAVEGINRHIDAAVEADAERDAWRTALLTAAGSELPEVLKGPEAHGEALREYIDGLKAKYSDSATWGRELIAALRALGFAPLPTDEPEDYRARMASVTMGPTYTPGELRAIRDALDVGVEGVIEDAGMWKADKIDHIERVAHHAAALARTLRALDPA